MFQSWLSCLTTGIYSPPRITRFPVLPHTSPIVAHDEQHEIEAGLSIARGAAGGG